MRNDKRDRNELARRRLVRVLRRHGVALMRTLEQKILRWGTGQPARGPTHPDPGPRRLAGRRAIAQRKSKGAPWYYLSETHSRTVTARLRQQASVYQALSQGDLPQRIGQALEIAVFRLLCDQPRKIPWPD